MPPKPQSPGTYNGEQGPGSDQGAWFWSGSDWVWEAAGVPAQGHGGGGPSTPKPTSPGTSHGQTGGGGPDGNWVWNATLGDWVWQSTGGDPSSNVSGSSQGTPTPAQLGGDFSDPRSIEQQVGDIGAALGLVPLTIDSTALGASLDTSGANTQRDKLNGLVDSLQQQAATGDGAWHSQFVDAVRRSQANIAALGQTQANSGGNYQSALRNIGNAQGASAQRAVGDEQVLRAQSQLDARNQLSGILGNQAQGDIAQSAEAARVERARRLANQALIDQSYENRQATEKAASGASMTAASMSEGGRVPGQAKVFGDDEKNDTVPAMLSPGEIVIPRSIVMSPNADDAAARFVRAVQARGGARRFADGGDTGYGQGIRPATNEEMGGTGVGVLNFALPHVGRALEYQHLRRTLGAGGGGTLDTSQYRQTAGQQDALADLFSGQAAGNGPSIAAPVLQRTTDSNLAAAMGAGGRGMPAASVLQESAVAGGGAAADAARQRAIEQSQGQSAFAKAVAQRRAQEMQMASAQQQAGWEKTLADAGLSLKNQAALRGVLAGAGQAAAAFAGRNQGGGQGGDTGPARDAADKAFDEPFSDDSVGDFNPPNEDSQYAAFGGVIGLADGGRVTYDVFDRKKSEETGGPQYETQEFSAGEPKVHRHVSAWNQGSEPDAQTVDGKTVARKAPAPKESAFARAVRSASEYARQAAGSAALPFRREHSTAAGAGRGAASAPALLRALHDERVDGESEYHVQRAHGGPIPGYAEGGPTFDPYAFDVQRGGPAPVATIAWPSGQEPLVLPPPDEPRQYTGAELGLGGGWSPSAKASLPKPDTSEPSSGPTPAPKPEKTLVQVGTAPNGTPVVEQREGFIEKPIPGLRLKDESAPAPETKPKAPAASGGAPERPNDAAVVAEEKAAAQREYEAMRAAAQAQAQNAKAMADALETQVAERKAIEAKAQEHVRAAQVRFQQAQEDAARIDTTVNPGRFWATRSTGDKVLGILGLVLGALGAGPDGINRAAVMLNQAVDRDLEAQKAEHELRLKKGAQRIDSARSFYSMARDLAGDELAATDLAHAMALKAVAAKGEQLMASTNDAAAKARLGTMVAAIDRGAADRQAKGWEKAQDRAIEWAKVAAMRDKPKTGDAAAIKDARDAAKTFSTMKSTVEELKGLIGDTNVVTEKVGSKSARMETLAGELLLQVKEAEKLGALDKGSVAVAEQIIGDPTATFTLDSTKIAKLNTLLEQARRKAEVAAAAVNP